jgi:hypothetical protein
VNKTLGSFSGTSGALATTACPRSLKNWRYLDLSSSALIDKNFGRSILEFYWISLGGTFQGRSYSSKYGLIAWKSNPTFSCNEPVTDPNRKLARLPADCFDFDI